MGWRRTSCDPDEIRSRAGRVLTMPRELRRSAKQAKTSLQAQHKDLTEQIFRLRFQPFHWASGSAENGCVKRKKIWRGVKTTPAAQELSAALQPQKQGRRNDNRNTKRGDCGARRAAPCHRQGNQREDGKKRLWSKCSAGAASEVPPPWYDLEEVLRA